MLQSSSAFITLTTISSIILILIEASSTLQPKSNQFFIKSTIRQIVTTSLSSAISLPAFAYTASDEFSIDFQTNYLGMVLAEEEYKKKSSRIIIRDTKPDGEAHQYADRIKGSILLSIGSTNIEGQRLSKLDMNTLVKDSPRPLNIRFRSPSLFFSKLRSNETIDSSNFATTTEDTLVISSVIRPGNKENPPEIIQVEMIDRPNSCKTIAAAGDVLEISYTMKLPDGTLLSNSGATSKVDDNYFFVLGSIAEDPFPPGWDYGIYGMCVGETRQIINPPCLGYADKGNAEYDIPKNSALVYRVKLVSINGSSKAI